MVLYEKSDVGSDWSCRTSLQRQQDLNILKKELLLSQKLIMLIMAYLKRTHNLNSNSENETFSLNRSRDKEG